MTYAIVMQNPISGEGQDKHAVATNDGADNYTVITTHPTYKGACKLANRFNATGKL